MNMKRISHHRGLLHIETNLGIINIRVGLSDMKGRKVEAIIVTPDNYSGERKVKLSGHHNTRLIQLKRKV